MGQWDHPELSKGRQLPHLWERKGHREKIIFPEPRDEGYSAGIVPCGGRCWPVRAGVVEGGGHSWKCHMRQSCRGRNSWISHLSCPGLHHSLSLIELICEAVVKRAWELEVPCDVKSIGGVGNRNGSESKQMTGTNGIIIGYVCAVQYGCHWP